MGDLPAINIQRGRDHGLPGYVRFREACGGNPVNSFTDLEDTTPLDKIWDLQEAYDNLLDIDLFAGAMLESPLPGSQIGFTFTCILTAQFHNLRFGDRFWYERDDHQTGFTLPQLVEIRKSTLARVICDNADGVARINQNVFINFGRVVVDCDKVSFVNLNVFKEGKYFYVTAQYTYSVNSTCRPIGEIFKAEAFFQFVCKDTGKCTNISAHPSSSMCSYCRTCSPCCTCHSLRVLLLGNVLLVLHVPHSLHEHARTCEIDHD